MLLIGCVLLTLFPQRIFFNTCVGVFDVLISEFSNSSTKPFGIKFHTGYRFSIWFEHILSIKKCGQRAWHWSCCIEEYVHFQQIGQIFIIFRLSWISYYIAKHLSIIRIIINEITYYITSVHNNQSIVNDYRMWYLQIYRHWLWKTLDFTTFIICEWFFFFIR